MSWHDLLFMHWSVPAEAIRALVPEPLEIDTFRGRAWLGIVPFRMSDVAPRFVPGIPWLSAFPELNVRTYVTADDKPGVWFFSLDATNPIAVRIARAFFHLPYMDARIKLTESERGFDYVSRRTHRGEPPAELDVSYKPTSEQFFAKSGTLEYWLTSRYCLYAANNNGEVLRGEIDHDPWPLQKAECTVNKNTMAEAAGIELPDEPPHLLFVNDISVIAWTNQRLSEAADPIKSLALDTPRVGCPSQRSIASEGSEAT
ncbi:MAG: DUF2071 domain-containing protein [Planctomycetales bacterium]|nr:DUF2071 domain-containing protein [Planctomycetales bacterium]